VYLTWARIEKQSSPEFSSPLVQSNFSRLAAQPIVFQYMFFRTHLSLSLSLSTNPFLKASLRADLAQITNAQ